MLNYSNPPRWQDILQRGDIVLFRFPVADEKGALQPKARPCLVLERAVLQGVTFLKLAYGTSAMTRANRGHEVRVSRPDGMRLAGVREPTRFVGARTLLVSPQHSGFSLGPAGSPIIGRLDANLIERMNCIRLVLASKGFTWCNTRATRDGAIEACGFPDRNRSFRGARNSKGSIK
ncbi:hypothetical protein DSM110093_03136 [Sulfitobacter sp. DSM 110093]|nr:hypothetical protein DSM110093_03136 [Sulfitobacter sp. DSM 110093]